jgi:hypothetical protein
MNIRPRNCFWTGVDTRAKAQEDRAKHMAELARLTVAKLRALRKRSEKLLTAFQSPDLTPPS